MPTLFYTVICSLVIGLLLIRSGCDGEDAQPRLLPQGTLLVQIYLTTELCSTLEPYAYKGVRGTENVSFNNAIVSYTN